MTTRRRTHSIIAAGLALAALGIAPASSASQAKQPDLVVKAAEVTGGHGSGQRFVVRGKRLALTWSHRTQNAGTAAARASVTGLSMTDVAGNSFAVDQSKVGRLQPSKAATETRTDRQRFGKAWRFGTYRPSVCADNDLTVAESDDVNNCLELDPFFVVPATYTGSVVGTGTLKPGVTMTWSGTVTGTLLPNTAFGNKGTFDYVFLDGPIEYTISGTDSDGCTWSGTGAYEPSTTGSNLEVQLGPDPDYFASGAMDQRWSIATTISCPAKTATTSAIAPWVWGFLWWLQTGPTTLPLSDPGMKQVSGIFSDPDSPRAIQYSWSLKPA